MTVAVSLLHVTLEAVIAVGYLLKYIGYGTVGLKIIELQISE